MPHHIPNHPDAYAGWSALSSFDSYISVHRAMDCPKRKALNALLKAEQAKEREKRILKSLTMGALRLLNIVKKQPASNIKTGRLENH